MAGGTMKRFGVAGYPPAFAASEFRKDRVKIMYWLASLGLDALELQMTYGPRTKKDTCLALRAAAEDAGISLSVHAAYFIVFTSPDKHKVVQSADTLKRTFDLCDVLGSKIVVLHPGPLYQGDAADALSRFCDNVGHCMQQIGKVDIGLFVETAGKLGQLGSTEEILEICNRVDGLFPCIDFGHVHARTLGTLDNEVAVVDLVSKLNSFLSIREDKRIHFHFTPIHYGPKGEIQHRAIRDTLPTPEQLGMFEDKGDRHYHPRPEAVATALRLLAPECTVISETHNSQEEGALTLKELFYAPSQ